MCERTSLAHEFDFVFRQWEQSFPERFKHNNLNITHAFHGHCLTCGDKLSHNEMFPPGRCTRSMCEGCYEEATVNRAGQRHSRCLVCGSFLDHHKIDQQLTNPREVSNYLCSMADNDCEVLFTLLHNIVVGAIDKQRFNISYPHNHMRNAISAKVVRQEPSMLPGNRAALPPSDGVWISRPDETRQNQRKPVRIWSADPSPFLKY